MDLLNLLFLNHVVTEGEVIKKVRLLSWVMRWTLPNTASMRQNSSVNQTIYIGSVQDEI